jgi:hypothetical protein
MGWDDATPIIPYFGGVNIHLAAMTMTWGTIQVLWF